MDARWLLHPLALGAACAAVAGCSFTYVSGPPADHAQLDTFECERGWGVPVIDLAVGSGLVVWGLTAGETTSESFGQTVEHSSTDNLVTGLVTGVPFLAGAAWGFREVHRCRAALDDLARRGAEDAARRAGGGPGPAARVGPMVAAPARGPMDQGAGGGG